MSIYDCSESLHYHIWFIKLLSKLVSGSQHLDQYFCFFNIAGALFIQKIVLFTQDCHLRQLSVWILLALPKGIWPSFALWFFFVWEDFHCKKIWPCSYQYTPKKQIVKKTMQYHIAIIYRVGVFKLVIFYYNLMVKTQDCTILPWH